MRVQKVADGGVSAELVAGCTLLTYNYRFVKNCDKPKNQRCHYLRLILLIILISDADAIADSICLVPVSSSKSLPTIGGWLCAWICTYCFEYNR